MRNTKLRRIVVFTLTICIFTAVSCCVSFGYTGVDTWFVDEIAAADEMGMIPSVLDASNMSKDISRSEFCAVAVETYGIYNDLGAPTSNAYFNDTTDNAVMQAYELGIVSGYDDGTFKPDKNITRQEMYKMIFNLAVALGQTEYCDEQTAANLISGFSDGSSIQSWAAIPVGTLISWGIAKGNGDGTLAPLSNSSRAQAIVLTYRTALKLIEDEVLKAVSTADSGIDSGLAVADAAKTDTAVVVYEEIPGVVSSSASSGTASTANAASSSGTNSTASDTSSKTSSAAAPAGTSAVASNTGKSTSAQTSTDSQSKTSASVGTQTGTYTCPLSLSGFLADTDLTSLKNNSSKYSYIFGSTDAAKYASAEEAESHMVTVTVPVWTLQSDGTKVASTKDVDVNEALKDVTLAIFTEIYNGSEQFPINSLGGYSWRGDTSNSSHKWGVAFDLNPSQNYYISAAGKVLSGSYWLPGEDPLSIPEDSEVVKIFAKYGFAWGGTAWTSSKDYMHFCFFAN